MRPSIEQILANQDVIREALIASGYPKAVERLGRLLQLAADYWTLRRYLNDQHKERTRLHQTESRSLNWIRYQTKLSTWEKLRILKQVARIDTNISNFKARISERQKIIEAMIDKWPDLDLDISQLATRVKAADTHSLFRKRLRRRKARQVIIR